ncbi:MAG TPA: energy transducer TonB [Gemmatimonadales bacterium]|nr:energy transducer TonB [Gemmatimonadales bacterium]
MFDRLPESNRKRSKSLTQNTVSLVVHAALIYGAIEATKGAAETLDNRLKDTTMVFVEAPKPTPPPPPPPQQQMIVAANPPPQGFQTITPPTEIPTEIPPVDLNQRFDPRDFTGKGVEGGIATGVAGGTGPVPTVSGEVFLSAELDDPPTRMSGPELRYPPAMKSAGISAVVQTEFIIDTTGHVEPSSFKVLNTPPAAFIEPARETITKAVYKPGKMRGVPQRTLVRQSVSFKQAE